MAIDDNTLYGLTGAQIKDLPEKIEAVKGATELTTADYNYPTNNPTSVALWLLEPGVYKAESGVTVRETGSQQYTNGCIAIVGGKNTSASNVLVEVYPAGSSNARIVNVSLSNGAYISGGIVTTGVSIAQSTGTSTTDVMSQNAVTNMVFADPSQRTKVLIGGSSVGTSVNPVVIGQGAGVRGDYAIAIGGSAGSQVTSAPGGISLGAFSSAAGQGQMSIGLDSAIPSARADYGYNGSAYRLLTGLYDPQSDHDAATKGYVDSSVSTIGAGTRRASSSGWNTSAPLDYIQAADDAAGGSSARGTMFYTGMDVSDFYEYAGVGAVADTPDKPYWLWGSMYTNGTFTGYPNSARLALLADVPSITMQTTDPGEGQPLAANNFIAVYNS